jgi:hypothetical protein
MLMSGLGMSIAGIIRARAQALYRPTLPEADWTRPTDSDRIYSQ